MKLRPRSMLPMLSVTALAAVAAQPLLVANEIVAYPFTATATRAAAIQDKFKLVAMGMTPADVKAILGEPDEVRPLYAPIAKSSKQIGYTYWYVVRRMVSNGSVNEKQEAAVRISFDLQARVTNIAHWGLDETTPSINSKQEPR